MAEKFTAKQREIVARKLGYDGPMQGFNNFINSSPALAMKYAAISDKFATRMAKGGVVAKAPRKKFAAGGAVQEANFLDFLKTPGLSDAQIVAEMDKLGITPERGSAMTGVPVEEVQSRYAAVKSETTANTASSVRGGDADYYGGPDTSMGTTATTTGTTANTATTGANTGTTTRTNQDIFRDFLMTPNLTDAQIAIEMGRLGITNQQLADISGFTTDEVNQRYNALSSEDQFRAFLMTPNLTDAQVATEMKRLNVTPTQVATITGAPLDQVQSRFDAATKTTTGTTKTTTGTTTQGPVGTRSVPAGATTFSDTGRPQAGEAAQVGVDQIVATTGQDIATANRAGAAETATAGQATATTAATPTTVTTSTYDATQAAENIGKLMAGVAPAVGSLTDENLVKAEQMTPTSTALADMKAAQGVAGTVQGAPTRTEQAGEMVSGPAVDQARTDALAAQTEASAAQGVVTEEMTVQGQLNKLMTDFESGNPPPWAAANLRAVTATLAARGLGASSLAGQALIQATLESALPIASADAQAYQSVAAQNLSNRQQTAVLAAQQRAAFMGQEFDQEFQTRVVNAAKVSDIANMNFTAQQQVALENARLAQTMDLANLSNNQAMVMANAAQIASLETTNLNNRQQAAVVNAQSFLQMDMANLSNTQQTTLFKAQQMTQAMLSDTAADNAAKQFNATSTNQTNQFNTQIATQVSQFNSAQQNAIAQFNTDQANAIAKFNAEVKNQRETFNAQQRLVIDQANAQWQREIATANTAATNAANIVDAQLSQQMTMAEYNNETQMYRDDVAHAWQSAENDASRATQLAAAEISAAASISAANIKADAADSEATGVFISRVLGAVIP